jgi:hypothetical protein
MISKMCGTVERKKVVGGRKRLFKYLVVNVAFEGPHNAQGAYDNDSE